MCLAQGHDAVTPLRLDTAALRSRVKHSTTEPLCSPSANGQGMGILVAILVRFMEQNPDSNFG